MQLIRCRAYARAGLVGNPSDGYSGKTISLIVKNYFAQVVLYEWEDMELVLSQEDKSRFRSIHELAHDVQLHGYYGGIRLVKATIKSSSNTAKTAIRCTVATFPSATKAIFPGWSGWRVPARLSWPRCGP